MHADVAKGHLHPDRTEEGIELWRNSLVEELRQHEGFKGMVLMGDRDTGENVAITLWETEEDFRAAASDIGHRETFSEIGPLYAEAPEFSNYEVFLREEG